MSKDDEIRNWYEEVKEACGLGFGEVETPSSVESKYFLPEDIFDEIHESYYQKFLSRVREKGLGQIVTCLGSDIMALSPKISSNFFKRLIREEAEKRGSGITDIANIVVRSLREAVEDNQGEKVEESDSNEDLECAAAGITLINLCKYYEEMLHQIELAFPEKIDPAKVANPILAEGFVVNSGRKIGHS